MIFGITGNLAKKMTFRALYRLEQRGRLNSEPIHLDVRFADELGLPPEPYERLLDAALRGDHHLFARQDAVEETWRIIQPLLDDPPPLHTYLPGSFGPAGTDDIVRGSAAWHHPWLP